MITTPIDILEKFPIRKSKKQKSAFRSDVQTYCESLGYTVSTENGSMGATNVVIGNPNTAKYLVTAHYDTPASMFLPNFITPCNLTVYLVYQFSLVAILLLVTFLCCFAVAEITNSEIATMLTAYIAYFGLLFLMMAGPANKHNANDNTSGVVTVLDIASSLPENFRDRVCFVLFDLEEAGLLGSAAYRKAHKKQSESQIVLNLDCVGDGDEIVMFPTKKLRKNQQIVASIDKISRNCGEKRLYLHKKGFAFCPSDQTIFPLGMGIMAFHRKKGLGLYCSRIHTNWDTILEITNVNILRAAITTLICQN